MRAQMANLPKGARLKDRDHNYRFIVQELRDEPITDMVQRSNRLRVHRSKISVRTARTTPFAAAPLTCIFKPIECIAAALY